MTDYSSDARRITDSELDTLIWMWPETNFIGLALRELKALRERCERMQDVCECAQTYFTGYCQDEADDPEVCSQQQHADALYLKFALERLGSPSSASDAK